VRRCALLWHCVIASPPHRVPNVIVSPSLLSRVNSANDLTEYATNPAAFLPMQHGDRITVNNIVIVSVCERSHRTCNAFFRATLRAVVGPAQAIVSVNTSE
jgi:hypothetical protein